MTESVRLGRLFGSSGRSVIVACDHGEFDGPVAGLCDPLDLVSMLTSGVDGILMSPGTLARTAGTLGRRNAAIPIVRLNWNSVYCFSSSPQSAAGGEVISPEEALRLGADVALVSLTLMSGGREEINARNVELFSRLAHGCKRVGLPVIGEYFPLVGPDMRDPNEVHAEIRAGARILYELGADAVKTVVDPLWDDLAATCPVPILGLGSVSLPNPVDALRLARGQVRAGARGVVYGRNVFQAEDPRRFMIALAWVVHDDAPPDAAWQEAATSGGDEYGRGEWVGEREKPE